MFTRYVTAVSVAIVLGAAPASVANDMGHPAARSGGPPTIDIQRTCRANVGALSGVGVGQDMDVCLSDEREAQQQLVKEWASYPAFAKSQCAQTTEYLPSYVEGLSCIEMTRDVLQLRKQNGISGSESEASSKSSGRRGGRDCPVTKYTAGGSIEWVINC